MIKRWFYLLVAVSLVVALVPSDWADNLIGDWKVVDTLYLSSRDRNPANSRRSNIPTALAAAAQGLYAEGIGVTASTTSWVDVCTIAAGSFTAGKTYLIYANAIISSSNSTSEARIRLVYGTTPTVFTDASAAYELTLVAAGTGNRTNYSYMTVFTQPEPTVLVKLQISHSTTYTTTAELGQIFTLKLSDDFVQNTDWCYTEVTTDYTTEANFSDTSSTDAASCSLLTNGSDDYLAIASAIIKMTATAYQYRMSLYESVTNVDEPVIDIEGEDVTNEFRGHTLTRTYAAPSAVSHLWQPRFNDESTAYTVLSTRIFVINLNKFSQHSYSYATAEEAPAATPSWTTTRTIAPTPDVTGDWFVFGSFGNDANVLTDDLYTRLQINPSGGGLVSNPAYGDDAPHEDSWDTTDVTGFNIFKMVSLSSGGARTINLDVQMNSGTTLRVQERHLVAFSLELLAAAVPLSVTAPANVTLATDVHPGETTPDYTFSAGTEDVRVTDATSNAWSLTVISSAFSSAGGALIAPTNVKLKTNNNLGTTPTTRTGGADAALTESNYTSGQSIDTAQEIVAGSATASGSYAFQPTFCVVIPPNATVTDYTAQFIFTVA